MATQRLTGLLGNAITSVMVTVIYDPASCEVKEVVQITIIDNVQGKYTDVTDVFCDGSLDCIGDKLVDSVDWREKSRAHDEPVELIA